MRAYIPRQVRKKEIFETQSMTKAHGAVGESRVVMPSGRATSHMPSFVHGGLLCARERARKGDKKRKKTKKKLCPAFVIAHAPVLVSLAQLKENGP